MRSGREQDAPLTISGRTRRYAAIRMIPTPRHLLRLLAAGIRLVSGIFLGLALGCTGNTTGGPDSVAGYTARLDRRVPEWMKAAGVPGVALAVVHEGDLVWSGAYGTADPEAGREMTVDAVFRVESISKSVTAWGVMKLVQDGLIDLEAPVERYVDRETIPALSQARIGRGRSDSGITIRRLLSHDAGLAVGTIDLEFPPPSKQSAKRDEEMPSLRQTLAREARLVRQPGTGFGYSNVGFDLLELVIEEVTGRDFAEYMAAEILAPLGMKDSGFGWNEERRERIPVGTDLRGRPVPTYIRPTRASGGLFATVGDIARFVRAEMIGPRRIHQSVLGGNAVRSLHAPRIAIPGLFGLVADAYGFGHFVEILPDGRRAIWHGGQGHGWMSHFHAVPGSGEGIVILTNSQRSWPLMAEILRDWGAWAGIGSVGMTRISTGVSALRILTLAIFGVALGQFVRLVLGLRRGSRRFAPLGERARLERAGMVGGGVAILAGLAWSARQPYLLVSSIFPGTARLAGLALLSLALVLVLSAMMSPAAKDGPIPR
ncbi:MAG TPA: class A beta-lactamase-related serine hydrolase [Deltaproteobacteria bacterium]|nr:class A beta-lactamase-related serine hydrolase [Deltaproteobacteria bacterium]